MGSVRVKKQSFARSRQQAIDLMRSFGELPLMNDEKYI